MSRTSILAVLAGAALSSGAFTTASAQTSTTDKDRAYAAELLASSQKATSAAPSTGAFKITDGSGNYVLQVGGYTQFRYVMNWRDNPPDVGGVHDSGFTSGFEATRTRINFSGNVVNPDMKFRIEGGWSDAEGTDSSGGAFTLLDAYGHYHFNNGMYLKWGQFKPALLREESIDNPYQLTADRSVMDVVFSQGWSQGVELGWMGDAFGFRFDFTDGVRSQNQSYSAADADWALTARLDWKWAGDWSRFDDFTSFRNSDFAGLLGVAAHYEQRGNTATTPAMSTPQEGLLLYTIDASVEGNGWNAFAAFVGSHTEPDEGDGFDDFGFLVQAGVFLTEQAELFGRWDSVWVDEDRGASVDEDFNTLTAGVNYYVVPESHAAKFTVDAQWFLNEPGDNALVSGGGYGPQALQPSSDDNQLALRLQFQLMF